MTDAEAEADRIAHNLTRLIAVRECAARLFGRDQKGRDFFARGVAQKVVQADTLSDLTAAYARIARQTPPNPARQRGRRPSGPQSPVQAVRAPGRAVCGPSRRGRLMVNHTLKENCEPCPACELRRERLDLSKIIRDPVSCNECKGTGLRPIPPAEIVRRAAEAARRDYWPMMEARFKADAAKKRRAAARRAKRAAATDSPSVPG